MLVLTVKARLKYAEVPAWLLVLASPHLNSNSSLALDNEFNDEEAWGEIKKQAKGTVQNMKNDDDDSDDGFNDDDNDGDSDVTISDIFPLVTSTPPAQFKESECNAAKLGQPVNSGADGMMASTPPTSALVTKLFPQLKPKLKTNVRQNKTVSYLS